MPTAVRSVRTSEEVINIGTEYYIVSDYLKEYHHIGKNVPLKWFDYKNGHQLFPGPVVSVKVMIENLREVCGTLAVSSLDRLYEQAETCRRMYCRDPKARLTAWEWLEDTDDPEHWWNTYRRVM